MEMKITGSERGAALAGEKPSQKTSAVKDKIYSAGGAGLDRAVFSDHALSYVRERSRMAAERIRRSRGGWQYSLSDT